MPSCAVHVVIDGNESDTVSREISLQIVSGIYVVSTKAGEILDDHTVDFAFFNIMEHTLKGRAFKIGACVAIVCIMIDDGELWVPGAEVFNNMELVQNTVALDLVAIFTG